MNGVHLLLDLGNTRLKWVAAAGPRQWLEQGEVPMTALDGLAHAWQTLPPPEAIHGCCVGDETRRAALDALCLRLWQRPAVWLAVTRSALGVTNRYRHLEQQGPDRWAAVLGAHALHPGHALVVAGAGTALTVDSLAADGTFLGGMILPGYRMMKAALAAGTARLPLAEGHFHHFPTSTDDAIETGVLTALAASITTAFDRLVARGEEPLVLLSGGDAPRLAERLDLPVSLTPNLVLHGLAALAYAPGGSAP
ncbi:type III pantothenate kinase [Chitiniphilus purpureus]|uniref:Type III pantothenate kinase n=1 Tax=Chitiniphilus purpureus TaxID=2981137 RepID=A0ABY6DLV1_9NEIS|nr:type III pantothenate kinase [Chitiniphilus sp. CD1]UXY15319.1 type III pantothenate kinase [Chitiniphilus sp. CD1]